MKGRSPGLDLLRAVAIAWVLLFHGRVLHLGTTIEPVSRFGWMGVDLFFVLSGFLIGTQWLEALRTEQPNPFRRFYVRRAFRIIPAYLVVLAVYFAWPAAREAEGIEPLWEFLTFTENLFIRFTSPRAFTHVWSLCVEEHFYVVFPLISCVLVRSFPRAKGPTLLVLVMGGVALRWWLWRTYVANDEGSAYYERIYYPTWARLDGLLAGLFAAGLKVMRPEWWSRVTAGRMLLAVACVSLLGASMALFADGPTELAATVGFPLIAAGMGALVVLASTWTFELPGASALATVAYSLYLSHKLVFAAVRSQWGEALGEHDVLAFGAYGSAALLGGAVLYWAVERPFLRLRAGAHKRAMHL